MSQSSKIARLPHRVREQLNLRLESAEDSTSLLPWLNNLREVKKVLERNYDGKPINKQNLSHWRRHGYQTWLIRRELWQQAAEARELSNQIDSEHANILADDVVNVTAARYASMLLHWDGKPDEKFHACVRTLDIICRGAVRMQRSMHRAREANEQSCRRQNEDERQEAAEEKGRMVQAVMDLRTKPIYSDLFGGGEIGDKLADVLYRVRNDFDPPVNLRMTGNETTAQKKPGKSPKKRSTKQKKPAPEPESVSSAPSVPSDQPSSVVKLGQDSKVEEPPPPPAPESEKPAPPEDTELNSLIKMANQGHGHSQYALGARYRDGFGVPKDFSKAREWLEKAAARGLGPAKWELHALLLSPQFQTPEPDPASKK